jgi:hypothetical protein
LYGVTCKSNNTEYRPIATGKFFVAVNVSVV